MSKKTTHPKSFMIGLGLFLAFCFAVGVTFYHQVEGLSLVDAFYLSAMTLTTVGYGDFAPQTDAGKLFTSGFAFLGVATFLGFAAALFQAVLSRYQK